MSILIDETSRVLVQGFTGDKGTFHAKEMIAFGTKVVGGVTPGKGGTPSRPAGFQHRQGSHKETGATHSITFVAPAFCADAIMEAADAGITLVCSITDGIPAQDMMRVKRYLLRYQRDHRTMMVGPNCAGIISPGKAMLGIMPGNIYMQGAVGIVSRSGTLGYEAAAQMKALGIGVSTSVGIGGDPINGSSFLDHLVLFERDPETKAVMMIGEIGGPAGSRGGGVDQEPHDQTGGWLCRGPYRAERPPHGPCRRDYFGKRRQRRRKGGNHEILRADRGAKPERTWHDDGQGFGALRIPAHRSANFQFRERRRSFFTAAPTCWAISTPFRPNAAGLPMTEFRAGRPGFRGRKRARKHSSGARR